MAKDVWWLRERGQIKGPFRRADLKAMKSGGQLNRFHKVSQDKKTWYSATEVDLDSTTVSAQSPTSPTSADFPTWMSADETVGTSATASVVPPPVTQAPPPTLTEPVVIPFPVLVLLFMHFATLGLFTFIWGTHLHGRLPRLAGDDMTASRAFKLVLIPFVNLFWGNFAVYPELCRKINRVRDALNLPGRLPVWYATGLAGVIAASVTLCLVWGVVTFETGIGIPRTVKQARRPPILLANLGEMPGWLLAQEEVMRNPELPERIRELPEPDQPEQSLPELMQADPMDLVRGDPLAFRIFLIPGISLGLLSLVILIPIFAALVQSSCNQIGLAQIRLLQSRRTS